MKNKEESDFEPYSESEIDEDFESFSESENEGKENIFQDASLRKFKERQNIIWDQPSILIKSKIDKLKSNLENQLIVIKDKKKSNSHTLESPISIPTKKFSSMISRLNPPLKFNDEEQKTISKHINPLSINTDKDLSFSIHKENAFFARKRIQCLKKNLFLQKDKKQSPKQLPRFIDNIMRLPLPTPYKPNNFSNHHSFSSSKRNGHNTSSRMDNDLMIYFSFIPYTHSYMKASFSQKPLSPFVQVCHNFTKEISLDQPNHTSHLNVIVELSYTNLILMSNDCI